MSTEKCRLIQLFLRIPALKPSNKYEIDLRTQLHGFFFLFSLYAFPPKGALGYEADNFMVIDLTQIRYAIPYGDYETVAIPK